MNRNELLDPELDAEIARGLQELLAMEPSPEFVPAVRRRLGNESAPSGWPFGRTLVLAGAMTVALVAGVVLLRPNSTPRDQQRQSSRSLGSALPAPIHTAEIPERTTAGRPVAKVTQSTVRPHTPGPVLVSNRLAEPEVLVSPGEAAALRRLFTDIGAGRVELGAADLPTTTEQVSELTGIHPLVPVTLQEGVLQ